MGFRVSVDNMTQAALGHAQLFFADFWPIVALYVGLAALAYVVNIFLRQ